MAEVEELRQSLALKAEQYGEYDHFIKKYRNQQALNKQLSRLAELEQKEAGLNESLAELNYLKAHMHDYATLSDEVTRLQAALQQQNFENARLRESMQKSEHFEEVLRIGERVLQTLMFRKKLNISEDDYAVLS